MGWWWGGGEGLIVGRGVLFQDNFRCFLRDFFCFLSLGFTEHCWRLGFREFHLKPIKRNLFLCFKMFLKCDIVCSLIRSTFRLARALSGWYFSTKFWISTHLPHISFISAIDASSHSSFSPEKMSIASICYCSFWHSCSSSVLSSSLCSSTLQHLHHWPPGPWTCPETQYAPLSCYRDHPQSPLELISFRQSSWSYKALPTRPHLQE